MLVWMLSGIAVYYIALFTPSIFYIFRSGLGPYLGTRDNDPEPSVIHARAKRAAQNTLENLPVFLALALAAMIMPDVNQIQATQGAAIFVIARAVYLPAYWMAVPFVRSLTWTIGFVGLLLMGLALI